MNEKLAIHGGEPAVPAGPPAWPKPDQEVLEAMRSAFEDGSWGKYDGPNTHLLKSALEDMHGGHSVLTCSSGTIAVELALRGVQVAAGDEVVLAGYDFSGNFRSVEAVGAVPVLVDIEPATGCLDANQLELAISQKTKAVIVSHLHGGTASMRKICELARSHEFFVVEDACQVPGALIDGRMAGTWGDVGVLSFGGSKLLTAGRGGAVVSRHAAILQRIKIHSERGNVAFPLSELQAAVLRPQLRRLAERNAIRLQNVQLLRQRMQDITCLQPVATATTADQPAFYKLGFRCRWPESIDCSREQFVSAMQAEGIALAEGFRGFVLRSARRCRKVGTLAESQHAAAHTALLHHPVLLESRLVIEQVANGFRKVTRSLLADASTNQP